MPYPVIQVDPEWVIEQEQLGTKDKFWVRKSEDSNDWLFKFPTPGTGQHWAEKIAFEIARKIKILAPSVKLAEMDGKRGSITANFTHGGYDLFHGNQIIARFDSTYRQDQRFRQNDHTIHKIFVSLARLWQDQKFVSETKDRLAGYLVLDALICNVDRHHENWGVLRKQTPKGPRGRLAPSFDHASSMGRELQDNTGKQNRYRYIHELGIAKYIERGHGPIFVDGEGKRGPSPLRLIQRSLEIEDLAPHFQAALPKIKMIKDDDFQQIIDQIPDDWMTPLARKFTYSLLCESHKQLTCLL